jgi:hypothetical protein
MRTHLLLAALTTLSASSAAAQTLSIPGGGSIGTWGHAATGATPTYGQTFSALSSPLADFSFWLQRSSGGAQSFRAYIFAWTGGTITGPALWTSGVLTAPTLESPGFERTTATVGGLSLTAGATYVALFSTLGEANSSGRYRFETATSTAPAGDFVYNNLNAAQAAALTSGWQVGQFNDLRFEANFAASTVPEPGTWALLGTGLLSVAGVARRRRGVVTTA